LVITAFIDEDCLDGLTPDQVNEIESYVEENI
jgi:hypothetical protein